MSKNKDIALRIKYECDRLGWEYFVRGDILEIRKPVETQEDFVKADSEYYFILTMLPQTSAGSIWGTDGGGVGAISAMTNKMFVMKMSGGSKRVLNALSKTKGDKS